MQESINYKIGKQINKFIVFFYPPFKHLFSQQFFCYGVCGMVNVVFGWFLYWFLYHFVFKGQMFDLGFIAFTPHIATFFTQLPITFLTGFWLGRYVSFSNSKLHGRIQIFRYLLIVICCILINYTGLKFFVEVCNIYPTYSQVINTIITTIFSFFAQKYFSFK